MLVVNFCALETAQNIVVGMVLFELMFITGFLLLLSVKYVARYIVYSWFCNQDCVSLFAIFFLCICLYSKWLCWIFLFPSLLHCFSFPPCCHNLVWSHFIPTVSTYLCHHHMFICLILWVAAPRFVPDYSNHNIFLSVLVLLP